MLLDISFPGGEDIQSWALTRVGWCPLEFWCLGPSTCLLRKLQGGTGEHMEVLTGCDLRVQDKLGSVTDLVPALSFYPGVIL